MAQAMSPAEPRAVGQQVKRSRVYIRRPQWALKDKSALNVTAAVFTVETPGKNITLGVNLNNGICQVVVFPVLCCLFSVADEMSTWL